MKILSLEINNYRGITAFNAQLDGKHGLIRGSNGAGKTSAINALIFALGGKVEDGLGEPMRLGASETSVSLDLGDYTVERVLKTGKAPKLVVRNRDSEKVAKAQTFLNSLVPSGLAFRPLDFGRVSAKDQRALLLKAIGAEEELAKIAERHDKAYDSRRDYNRRVKELQAEAKAITLTEDPGPEVSVQQLAANLDQARQQVADRERWETNGLAARERVNMAAEAVKEAHTALEAASSRHAQAIAAQKAHAEAEPIKPDEGKVGDYQKALDGAEANNAQAREWKRKLDLQAKLSRLGEEVGNCDSIIEACNDAKRDMLDRSGIMEGLEVRDDGIFVDNLPYASINTEQQLQIAIAIAMRQNPELRIILVDGAESIDNAHWRSIVQQADAANLQVIATEVDREGGDLTFEIVEGGDDGSD